MLVLFQVIQIILTPDLYCIWIVQVMIEHSRFSVNVCDGLLALPIKNVAVCLGLKPAVYSFPDWIISPFSRALWWVEESMRCWLPHIRTCRQCRCLRTRWGPDSRRCDSSRGSSRYGLGGEVSTWRVLSSRKEQQAPQALIATFQGTLCIWQQK